MKFMHISDLHLGKRVNEFSMLEDQKDILNKILEIMDDERPQALLIAGDIYDKSIPSVEAIQLFDDFLCEISGRGVQTFVISGNHDSAERISFGGRLMKESGVYVAPAYARDTKPIVLEDEWGTANVYLLPFIKPVNVKRFFEEEQIESYTDAVRVCVKQMKVNTDERNVLVTHQFVTGAKRSESEDISVGGTDNVDASVFDEFDYVALGHIHGPQKIGRETVRYCGTPLKYSFSEVHHKKSVTIVEMKEKGNIEVRERALVPLRDWCEIKGSYMELTGKSYYEKLDKDSYMHITLTDEEDIPEAVRKLQVIYPNLMKLDYDNRRTRGKTEFGNVCEVEDKTPFDIFEELYEKQNNQEMNEEQKKLIRDLIEKIWEGGH